jgi:hypothetical protein
MNTDLNRRKTRELCCIDQDIKLLTKHQKATVFAKDRGMGLQEERLTLRTAEDPPNHAKKYGRPGA